MSTPGMTYTGSGVDYALLDPFKRRCQEFAQQTSGNAAHLGFIPLEETRGESVFVIKVGDMYFGIVEEGLGTKNVAADIVRHITGRSHYDQAAKDTVAMIVNDLVTLGILPGAICMHLAVGSSKWFDIERRVDDMIRGWSDACNEAGCIWAGGETPTLRDIVTPNAALLSGSSFGLAPKGIFNSESIRDGDVIVFLTSSGIHANGLTMARDLAEKIPMGYSTKLRKPGRHMGEETYGEALLRPTHLYAPFIRECLEADVEIHYCINVTGHGWRKVMRAPQPFAYVIDRLPPQLPIFDFIQEHGNVTDEEMYGNFNMGAGFALIVPQKELTRIPEIATRVAERGQSVYDICIAGNVHASDKKQVVIEPKNLTFEGATLAVR